MRHKILIAFDLDVHKAGGAEFTVLNLRDTIMALVRQTFPPQFAVKATAGGKAVLGSDGKVAGHDVMIRVLGTEGTYLPHGARCDITLPEGTPVPTPPAEAPAPPAEGEPREMKMEVEARVPELPKPGLIVPT